jgi:hypothetical protein
MPACNHINEARSLTVRQRSSLSKSSGCCDRENARLPAACSAMWEDARDRRSALLWYDGADNVHSLGAQVRCDLPPSTDSQATVAGR